MVGWTIINRANLDLKCNHYPGEYPAKKCLAGLACSSSGSSYGGNCFGSLAYLDPPAPIGTCNATCALPNQRMCCAEHGGTTTVGANQAQFDDSHVSCADLCKSTFWEAFYVLYGMVPDPSNPNWIPNGHTLCTNNFPADCSRPVCLPLGTFSPGPSPNGPIEFRGRNYCPKIDSCLWFSSNVCGKHPPVATQCLDPHGPLADQNFFWNRDQTKN